MLKYVATVIGRLLSVLMVAVFLAALAIWVVLPEESLRFALADEPAHGWFGSLFFGCAFGGVLATIWIIGRCLSWLFRPLARTVD